MKYRSEIDGLRAIAVMPVIFYHAGFSAFAGGYIGVDIFFVISGYLITTLIAQELEKGSFSLLSFYERRARRILPALFVMIAATIPVAWFIMLPGDMKNYSQSLVGVSIFSSNVLFWLQSGYFDSAAALKPLIHTWSLSVEEQFYIIFPIFLSMLWFLKKTALGLTLVLLFFASFLVMQVGYAYSPTGTFYLPISRAWELLLGALAGLILLDRTRPLASPGLSSLLVSIGMCLIILAFFLMDERTPFPSHWALLPTLGTFLIILYGESDGWVSRLLRHRLPVGIGLISYSAYLWHQPLFAFAKYRLAENPAPIAMLGLCGLALLLAYASWRLIERPFRNRNFLSSKQVGVLSVLSLALPLTIGLVGHFNQGYPDRQINNVSMQRLADNVSVNYGLAKVCDGAFAVRENCIEGVNPTAVLWGDSFAMHLAPALKSSPTTMSFLQLTMSSCRPILDFSIIGKNNTEDWAKKCITFNRQVFEWLAANEQIDLVIMSSPFTFSSRDMYTIEGRVTYNAAIVEQFFVATLQAIQSLGKRVVVVSPTPGNGRNIGLCLSQATLRGQPLAYCNFAKADYSMSVREGYELLQKTTENRVPVVWLDDILCGDGDCKLANDGVFLYRDKGHLSNQGASHIGRMLDLNGLILAAETRVIPPE